MVGRNTEDLKKRGTTTSAKVLSVDVGDEETVARIHYAGDTSEVTIQSHWRDVDGQPKIVQAGPVN
jgi:hypothetical protein